GLLLASLTLGRGVIASDLPYFREILGAHPGAGILFPVGSPAGLAASIQRYLAIAADERAKSARTLAETFAWEKVVVPVAEIMKGWGKRKSAKLRQRDHEILPPSTRNPRNATQDALS